MESILKFLYYISCLTGLVICAYIFLHDPSHTSETELVNSIFYWYFPIVFGIGGLYSLAIQKEMRITGEGVNETVWLSNSRGMILRKLIYLPLLGFIGFLPHYLLLQFTDVEIKFLSLIAASSGLVWMFFVLYFFFSQIWPSL